MTKAQLLPLLLSILCLLAACKNDPCETVACQNGGTCDPETGSCQCAEGFKGAFCETFDLQRYFGEYKAAYQGCFVTAPEHRVTLSGKSGFADRLILTNLGDYACPSDTLLVEASIAGSAITMASQAVDCGEISYTFSGQGQFLGAGKLSLSFEVRYQTGGPEQVDACTVLLER